MSSSIDTGPGATNQVKDKADFTQRAQRFTIGIPIRYRETGTVAWLDGTTVNISKSGILFLAHQTLQPLTTLDVTLTLPAAISGEAPAEIGCRGTVVRDGFEAGRNGRPILAVSIVRYRFFHKRRNAARGGLELATS
ncbi:MAG: PilZ domain-containing protein [Terriglobia bacterium]